MGFVLENGSQGHFHCQCGTRITGLRWLEYAEWQDAEENYHIGKYESEGKLMALELCRHFLVCDILPHDETTIEQYTTFMRDFILSLEQEMETRIYETRLDWENGI